MDKRHWQMGRRHEDADTSAALPAELLVRVMHLLTWRETSAMTCVCSRWRSAVQAAADAHPEWRVTSLLAPSELEEEAPAAMQDAVERLACGHGGWADTTFMPNLVLLAARTASPRLFIKGVFWSRAVAAMERAHLLPPRCLVVGTLSVIARGGEGDVEEDGEDTVVATAAHLPGTRLATATFERKELRQSARAGGVEDPFAAADGTAAGLLLFSANTQSACELAAAANRWDVEASAIAGAVFPHADCANPLLVYQSGGQGESLTRQQQYVSKKKKRVVESNARPYGRQRQQQRQSRKAPTADTDVARGQVQFPSNLVVRLSGERVRMRTWTASGLTPVTPIMRCCDQPPWGIDPRAIAYSHAEVHRHLPEPVDPLAATPHLDIGGICLLKELMRARMDLSADQTLRIVASRDADALERFFRAGAAVSTASSTGGVEMIDCGYSSRADTLFQLGEHRWERGMFGVVIGRGSDDWRRGEALEESERALDECKARGGRPIGWLVTTPAPIASMSEGDLSMATTAMTGLAIGPSGGGAEVQQNATSGALLYFSRDK